MPPPSTSSPAHSNATPTPLRTNSGILRPLSPPPTAICQLNSRDDDDHFLDLEPLSLFSAFPSNGSLKDEETSDTSPNSSWPPLQLFSTDTSKSVVVHSVEFEPGFDPGERPCIRVELNGEDANQVRSCHRPLPPLQLYNTSPHQTHLNLAPRMRLNASFATTCPRTHTRLHKRPRTTTNNNNNHQSAHDLEYCGQGSEWSVEHRFEFLVRAMPSLIR